MGRENHLRRFGRQLPSRLRCAGLDDDRPALHRPRNVERPPHREMLALVIEHMQSLRIEIKPALGVADEGIVGEAVPQAGHDIVEFARAAIALVVLDMLVEPEIQRRVRIGRRHDVPAGAATADVIQRGEPAGNVIGRVECRRCGCDQPDMIGDGGKRRQQRERLEGRHRVAAPQRLDRHVEHSQMIGHEEGVELRRLQCLREAFEMCEIEIGVGIGSRIAPGACVKADGAHEGAEPQLPIFCHWKHLMWTSVAAPISVQDRTALPSWKGIPFCEIGVAEHISMGRRADQSILMKTPLVFRYSSRCSAPPSRP